MLRREFEAVLDRTTQFLTTNLRTGTLYHGPERFEQGVLAALQNAATDLGVTVEPTYHRHAFPDIRVNGYGVEVKYSERDTWNAVGNSVFESMRDPAVKEIYVLFGKVGGQPEARWAKYADCVSHVRVSNSPRFVVDMERNAPPLFERFEISYEDFAVLDDDGKMRHVRDYWRKRLPPGEHLWWLEPCRAAQQPRPDFHPRRTPLLPAVCRREAGDAQAHPSQRPQPQRRSVWAGGLSCWRPLAAEADDHALQASRSLMRLPTPRRRS